MISGLRRACTHTVMILILLCFALPAFAQTRAWLDRQQVTFGETATLNIETNASVQQIDYAPLTVNFEIAGQTVRRSFEWVNGRSSTRSLFAVGIRPRGPGLIMVPALRVGNSSTEPQQMTVMPPTVQPANTDADAFLQTEVDAEAPYVQQAVGMVVRLFVGVNLLSGQLDQDTPPGTSLQQVGEDVRYQRQMDGRRYNVIERRYLLTPERSGELIIPGARFNGQSVSGFFDGGIGDGRTPLSAAAPAQRLQVRKIPADATQPWLPLHDLRLRYLQVPTQARAGVATTVEVEMIADGASATQLPALEFPQTPDAQVFADPPQTEVQLVDGRPRATLRRRIAVVPLRAGLLSLAGPSVQWWDARQGITRTATLPPLVLQVATGAVPSGANPDTGSSIKLESSTEPATLPVSNWPAVKLLSGFRHLLPLLAVMLGLVLLMSAWWLARIRKSGGGEVVLPPSSLMGASPKTPSLADALKTGELGGIAHALCTVAGLPDDDLDTLRTRLDDAAQRAAVDQLQAARWGFGDGKRDPALALASVRVAFAKGLHLQTAQPLPDIILPPLYPKS